MSALPRSRHLGRRARRLAGSVAAGAVVLTTALASTTLASAGPAEPSAKPSTPERATSSADSPGEARGYYDARSSTSGAAKAMEYRAASKAANRAATRAFAKALPPEAVLDIDGTTGTVRMLAKLDGYLTGKSDKKATTVALKYVRANHTALGLTSGDLNTFKLKREYVDIEGVHHLYWIQRIGGQTVFSNGLTAAVKKDGRLLAIGGSPVSKATLAPPADLEIDTAGAAIADARVRLGAGPDSRAGSYDQAERVLFVTARGSHHAWMTTVMSVARPATQVVDAASGRLLYRNPLGNDVASPEAVGQVFRNYPGAKHGSAYGPVNFTRQGWLPRGATKLQGNNSHTYSDVDDNNEASESEEIRDFNNKLVPFQVKGMSFCKHFPCSWNPDKPFSWQTNREQNGTQVFYFVNKFHDHLLAKPIGFTEAAGNFEHSNSSKHGKGHDAVQTNTMDGASTDNGLPDGNHVDNANMNTPPDGSPPTMQMYLQHTPGTSYPAGDPFPANNTGDEAWVVYHEYTHGLSNRLVVDVLGLSTLGPVQADAMGEAWGDWYAADSLVSDGLEVDKKGKADLDLLLYDGAGADLIRSEGIDCTPKSPSSRCPGGATGHAGGYTYADYGKVYGVPEVHADGEIWAQTLWSLRDKVGSRVSRSLVTRAMELAPANPSFLDMRNALLIADTAHFKGDNHTKIWSVFASRGMGFFAGSLGGNDALPAADRHSPPRTVATGLLTGTVKDNTSGAGIAGVPVTLAFQGQGVVNPTAITDANGNYSVGPVPAGKYGKLIVNGAGYVPISTAVTVAASGSRADFQVTRDWAAASGGAKVVDFNGPDYTEFGCGPVHAIDTSLSTGWGSITGNRERPTNQFKPKFITVAMPQKVNITQFAVDPGATCGDAGSASTGAYRIETSPDNVTWTEAASGTFVVTDQGRLNPVTPITGALGVQYVRFRILGNQVPDFATNCPNGGFDGCTYTDLTELQVYGVATP